jgi:DNA-binding PadR family transcriptional regulator
MSMHKELLVLGLLTSGPRTGYDIQRIVAAHGDLYTDLKKGNVYYLLERLAAAAFLEVQSEAGAPGPLRERHIYTLTAKGRERFNSLLREVVRSFELLHTGVEVGMVFLPYLPPEEAILLLDERRQTINARLALVEQEAKATERLHEQLAQDHLVTLLEAERSWTERALQRLRHRNESSPPSSAASCPGDPTRQD